MPAANSFTSPNIRLKKSKLYYHSPIFCGASSDDYLFCAWGVHHYYFLQARPTDAAVSLGGFPASIANLGTAAKFFPAAKFQRFLDTGQMY